MSPLLIFDLDGTLIHSAQDITNALNRTLAAYGKPTVPYETVVAHIGEGLLQLLADFFPEERAQTEQALRIRDVFLTDYEEEMYNHTHLYPGVLEFLTRYPGPLGVVTNKNEDPARKLIQHLGLGQIPWIQIYGGDSLPKKKPDPLPLQEMMRLAGRTPQNTFMIGDGTPDMKAALAAGVGAIAVGFGYTRLEILKEFRPVASFNDYAELHNIVHDLINR